MIVQILVPQTELDALPQQLLDRVFDQPRIPVIRNTQSPAIRPVPLSPLATAPLQEVIFPPSRTLVAVKFEPGCLHSVLIRAASVWL